MFGRRAKIIDQGPVDTGSISKRHGSPDPDDIVTNFDLPPSDTRLDQWCLDISDDALVRNKPSVLSGRTLMASPLLHQPRAIMQVFLKCRRLLYPLMFSATGYLKHQRLLVFANRHSTEC